MPVLWSLRLAEPVRAPVPAVQLHGLVCALVEDPADTHQAQVKPFSVRAVSSAQNPPVIGVGWLDDAREPDLAARLAVGGLRLGGQPVEVAALQRRAVSYAELLASAPALKARVVFGSPTYVSRAGRQIPLPDPELLLAGLVRRWRAFSPVPIAEETVQAVLARVHVAQHRIGTVPVRVGKGSRVGFTGEVVFGLAADSGGPVRRLFAGLWRFAEFAGVGAQTTHGLGEVRVEFVQVPSSRRPEVSNARGSNGAVAAGVRSQG